MPATDLLLLVTTAAHLGFQLTVTLVVYPALAEVPAERWRAAHDAHSRRISVAVGVVYVAWALACVLPLVAWASGGERPAPAVLVVLASAAATAATTAFGAAPMHGRLASYDAGRVARLLAVDRARLVLGAVALAAAVVAVVVAGA
ncbi:MAG: hypothetical protein CMH83_01655 [Nocardioides sp.]|nr:hypothetical protein [Nocardioides sp.]